MRPLLQGAQSDAGLGPVQVQRFGSDTDVLLRFEHPQGTPEQQQAALATARQAVEKAAPGAEIRRVEVVGPSIGAELLSDGMWALGLAAIAMFAYITFRFEWPFAVGAIVTMFLDLTKTVGFLALTGFEFNLTTIAAILTIMGFSINDKVVVYDRVREISCARSGRPCERSSIAASTRRCREPLARRRRCSCRSPRWRCSVDPHFGSLR